VEYVTLVAVTVNVYVPDAVGVPDNKPAEESVKPVGNPLPTLKVYPPDNPLAVIDCE
jgi:hypothetical protein